MLGCLLYREGPRQFSYERALPAPQPLRVRATLYSAAATVTGAVVSIPW